MSFGDPDGDDPDRDDPGRADADRADPDRAGPDRADADRADPDRADPDRADPDRADRRIGPPGVVLAVDVGTVRVGVAASDPHRILASPVETVAAPGLDRVLALVAERDAVLVVVGLPTSMSGEASSASAQMAREWAAALQARTQVRLELVDERLTTVTAAAALRASGKRGRAARSVIDQAAAVALLQGWLERRTGA